MKTTTALDNVAKRHGWKTADAYLEYLHNIITNMKEDGKVSDAQDIKIAYDMIVIAQLTETL